MSNWATAENDINEEEYYEEEEVVEEDSEAAWLEAETVVDNEVDEDGNKIEITKLVLSMEVERELTPADLRNRFEPFGKGKEEKVGKPTVIALRLAYSTAKPFEKESKDEVRALLAEKFNEDEFVKSHPAFKRAKAAKDEITGRQRYAAEAAAGGGAGKGETYLDRRAAGTQPKSRATEDDKHEYKIRITNVADSVSEENLRKILDRENKNTIKSVKIIRDRDGNSRNFGFVEFFNKADREQALERHRDKGIPFKGVVIEVSPAAPQVARP